MTDIYKAPDANLNEHQASDVNGSLEKGMAGEYEFSVGGIVSEAWEKTSGNKGTFNLAFFLYFLVAIPIMMVAQFIIEPVILNNPDPAVIITITLVQQLLINLITLPIGVGLFMLGLRASVGAPTEATSIFSYFNRAFSLLLTVILMYLMIMIGLVLLVLPGIYLMVAYFMAMPLVVEKGLSPWQALEVSRKAITHKWFSVVGLMILMMIIMMVSIIPLGIPMIWTMPMFMIVYGIMYRNMFGYESSSVS